MASRLRVTVANSIGLPFTVTICGAPRVSVPFVTARGPTAFNPAVAALKAVGPLAVTKGTLTLGAPQIVTVNGRPIEFATVTRNLDAIAKDYEGSGCIDYQLSQHDKISG